MRRRAAAVLCALCLAAACSAPPQKEIDRAQGAIDAARAAGADQYARENYEAAVTAMQQTHEAVKQRDYRLALSRAVDANDRALEAARQAANGKAVVRSEAEMSTARGTAALRQLDESLKAAEAARLTGKEVEQARRTRTAADRSLQEARKGLSAGDYLAAAAASKGVADRITAQISAVNQLLEAKGGRGGRRRK
jgi:hypothetical protein